MKKLSFWGVTFASAAALLPHTATGQTLPGGTPVQSLIQAEAEARAAADSQLQSAIAAEATARAGMDATLLDAINEVRAESSIVGTYTFSGTQTCLISSFGFNDDLTPAASPDPTRAAVVSTFTAVSTGFRTFNPDGTGTAQFFAQVISLPGAFYTNPLPPAFPSSGVTSGGLGKPSGGATEVEQTSAFTWHIEGNKLFIEDSVGAVGVIKRGSSSEGCTIRNVNMPRAVGVLGKDLRIISISHEAVKVETGITECIDGRVLTSQRICNRERTLRKM